MYFKKTTQAVQRCKSQQQRWSHGRDRVVVRRYVNDAFGTAHRAHASTEGVVKHISGPAAGGFLMEKELVYIKGAIDAPKRPLTAILGGAKVSTKIPVIESMLDKCDSVLIGGGMIFTFYKAMGHSVGASLIEEDMIPMAKDLIAKAEAKGARPARRERIISRTVGGGAAGETRRRGGGATRWR